MEPILVIDDTPDIRQMLHRGLTGYGYEVQTAPDGKTAKKLLQETSFAVVVTDLKLPDVKDLELITFIKRVSPSSKLVVITAHATVGVAKECVRKGATAFIVKPFALEQMRYTIEAALAERKLVDEEEDRYKQQIQESTFCELVGKSLEMRKIYHTILTVAKTDSPVIICGETGTGKELVARAIHRSSARASRQMVAVNCASLSENLLESELFGHVKGAFTGAVKDKVGLLKVAAGSSVLLDEVSELSQPLQARLLRFLQNGEIRPVGSTAVQTSDARAIATTNLRLEDLVSAGRFREDLFHRLNVISITLPPLRERREDIPLLSHYFLKHLAAKQKKPIKSISPAALSLLMAQEWTGNVRELENTVERAVTFCTGDSLLPFHLYPNLQIPPGEKAAAPLMDLGKTVEATEQAQILKALQVSGGNKSKAAELLGIDRITLWRKIKGYGLSG